MPVVFYDVSAKKSGRKRRFLLGFLPAGVEPGIENVAQKCVTQVARQGGSDIEDA